jgi:hypothetical protein
MIQKKSPWTISKTSTYGWKCRNEEWIKIYFMDKKDIHWWT